MKMKKLDIIGFKSFSDKASILFPPGISAIVGPNGCGKSNVVDALRWVMGEQSVKQLRGKSMEDIIFAGASGRPPLNMAEVTLTLSNEDGAAPENLKDFTEIMITRRIYRSGETAYLLNKRTCRLKDIHEIFLGSGMGARSFAIIQQGNIGAITEAGPEERRVFIEEAAGVTRYKTRKKEALQKLNATEQDLLRLNDIIVEVKRQMDALNRQAQKAEKYKILQGRIKTLDILLAWHYTIDLTTQIEEIDVKIIQLKDQNLNHTTRLAHLDTALEDIKIKRIQKNQALADQKNKQFETQRIIDKKEGAIVHMRKEAQTLADEIGRFQGMLVALKDKNKDMSAEVASVQIQNDDLRQQINSAEALLEDEHRATETLREDLAALKNCQEKAQQNLRTLAGKEAQYKSIFQNASQNKANIERRRKRIDEEVLTAGRKVTELMQNVVLAQKDHKEIKEEVEELQEEIDALVQQIAQATEELTQHIKKTQEKESEMHRIKSQYTTLKKMDDNFEWYKDGIKSIMQRMNEASRLNDEASYFHPSKIKGLIADMLTPEKGYETAVEAVLGDALQYIIVNAPQTGMYLIEDLKTQNKGRGGIIALATINTAPPVTSLTCEYSQDRHLMDHITVKSGYEGLATLFFNDTVIADTLSQAFDWWQQNGQLTFVTRDGDLISKNGVLIGGTHTSTTGILKKKQELVTLHQTLTTLNQDLTEAYALRKRLEETLHSYESEKKTAAEEKDAAILEERQAEKKLYQTEEDLKHAKRHHEIITLEQEQLLGEEADIDEEVEKSNQRLDEVTQEVQKAQTEVERIEEESHRLTTDLDAYQQKSMDIKLRLTSQKATYDNNQNTIKRLNEFLTDGENRQVQLQEEITQKSSRKIELHRTVKSEEENLIGLYEQLKTMTQTLQTLELEYQELETSLKSTESQKNDIQTKMDDVQNKIRDLELKRSQTLIKTENLSSRIEEKYHHPIVYFKEAPLDLTNDNGRPPYPTEHRTAMENELTASKHKLDKLGDVNLGAISEYEAHKERFEFLESQKEDLHKAIEDLQTVIQKINKVSQEKFQETFELINNKLKEVFPRLFDGGTAELILTEPEKPLETGVEFLIHPPGKKVTRLSLLSGGEKALSAIAFIFSVFLIKPASFCLMDEIDAPLDEANVLRFNKLLRMIGEQSQIVMITHNKRTMEFSDMLFGVTMEKKGISKIVSVNLEKAA